MSTGVAPQTAPSGNGAEPGYEVWRDHTRVVLQPIAAPSVLGLFGFSAATFMVAMNLAGLYGSTKSPVFLFEFAAICGGVAQLIAANWAFRARDAIASAIHGMWGSFWIAYGLLFLLSALGAITIPAGKFPELGFWFLPLAAITFAGAFAATSQNLALTLTLIALGAGAALLAIAYLTGAKAWLHTGAWVLVASAILAFYSGTAMLFRGSFGRVVLPMGEPNVHDNVPGQPLVHPIEYAQGEPGVKQGQ